MLTDALVIYGLTVWENRLKTQKEARLAEESKEKESKKKASTRTNAGKWTNGTAAPSSTKTK